jgi:hypothetical protein
VEEIKERDPTDQPKGQKAPKGGEKKSTVDRAIAKTKGFFRNVFNHVTDALHKHF